MKTQRLNYTSGKQGERWMNLRKFFGGLLFLMALGVYSPDICAQSWTALVTNTTEDLKCLQMLDAQTGFAAGSNGMVIKTTDGGNSWSPIPVSGSTTTLRSVCFLDALNGWVAGDAGEIYFTSTGGSSWTAQNSGSTSMTITNIHFFDANNGWITGSNGQIKKSSNGGAAWGFSGTVVCGISGTIWGFHPINSTSFWVSGASHSLNNTTSAAASWTGLCNAAPAFASLPGTTVFEDVFFQTADLGWIVGGSGKIFQTTTGSAGNCNWTVQSTPTSNELLSIDMLDANTGWTCGRNGTMLSTTDGGATGWKAEATGITTNLWEVDFIDAQTGFAAGDAGVLLKYQPANNSAPLALLQPIGGEFYTVGSTQSIIWSANGVSTVNLDYSIDNGANWLPIASGLNAANGSYAWSIPNNPACVVLVRVSDAAQAATFDQSDASLVIQPVFVGKDYAVLMTASASNSPAQITLNWNSDPFTQSLTVDRKLKSAVVWTPLATLGNSATTYTDQQVQVGQAYEYRITRSTCSHDVTGYVYAGIEVPETEFRGTALLLVDQNYLSAVSADLAQYERDLIGDGYRVNRQVVDPAMGVQAIKNLILQQHALDPGITTVLSIGHLPAPYSGNFAPDGHAERVGAQPADGFYGDLDGNWTDVSVNTLNSGTIYTPNVPGDGIFDQDTFPSAIELQVGRIDMNHMDGFAGGEGALLAQYLRKNHDFRFHNFQAAERAIMNTTMDKQLPTTSASAWRSYSAMFGSSILDMNNCNTGCTDFKDSLVAQSYLWAHMAGGGSDTSMANDVFTSSQCINNPINTVFMQMYGSYLVEWYKGGIASLPNHLLRAPLASNGTTLATVWSGKAPSWHFHHMALGETIGYASLINMNNQGTYEDGMPALQNGVHMNLMGDPTLKMHIVAPIANLQLQQSGADVDLSWAPSADPAVVGYHIYRADSLYGSFTRLNATPVTGTSYQDVAPATGQQVYLVRALKLENHASGSYYNLSTGVADSLVVQNSGGAGLNEQGAAIRWQVYPNPAKTVLHFTVPVQGFALMNLLGELILSSDQPTQQLATDQLADGVYLLRSGNHVQRVVIKK